MSKSESDTFEPEAHRSYEHEDSFESEVEVNLPLDGTKFKAHVSGVGRAAKLAAIQFRNAVVTFCMAAVVFFLAAIALARSIEDT